MKKGVKSVTLLLALVIMAVFAFTGCKNDGGEAVTLYDTNTLKIEQEGAETRIYDLKNGAEYNFTSHKVRIAKGKAANVRAAKTTTDNDTIAIQSVYGVIIVTVKSTGETIYIK